MNYASTSKGGCKNKQRHKKSFCIETIAWECKQLFQEAMTWKDFQTLTCV